MARKPRPAAKPRVSEKSFQSAVIDLARYKGWKVAHFHDSRRDVGGGVLVGDSDADGFPDLVMVSTRRGVLLHVELKADDGSLTPEQYEWGLALCEAFDTFAMLLFGSVNPAMRMPFDYRLWQPKDWPEIEAVL
jgi:hypothetical protein